MAQLPTQVERKALETLSEKLRLLEANKVRARDSLLRIQLLLAKQPQNK